MVVIESRPDNLCGTVHLSVAHSTYYNGNPPNNRLVKNIGKIMAIWGKEREIAYVSQFHISHHIHRRNSISGGVRRQRMK